MSVPATEAHALTILVEDRLATITRVLGLLRRRNFPVRTLATSPAAEGLVQLTVTLAADAATTQRAVLHVQKVIGVREVATHPLPEPYQERR